MNGTLLEMVRRVLGNPEICTASDDSLLSETERAWLLQQWQEAQAIALRYHFDTTQKVKSLGVAVAMPEWVNPYVRRVVALYPRPHLLRRLASKTLQNSASSGTPEMIRNTLEITQIPVGEPAGST